MEEINKLSQAFQKDFSFFIISVPTEELKIKSFTVLDFQILLSQVIC